MLNVIGMSVRQLREVVRDLFFDQCRESIGHSNYIESSMRLRNRTFCSSWYGNQSGQVYTNEIQS